MSHSNVAVLNSAHKDNNNPDWDLDRIVFELRTARAQWRLSQGREPRIRDLPERAALREIVQSLFGVLFPLRLGPANLREESEDFFVGLTLDTALNHLLEQIRLELNYVARTQEESVLPSEAQAREIARNFASKLPRVRRQLDSDALAAYRGDPAARSVDEVLVCYPGIIAVAHYRIANVLYSLGLPLIARIITEIAHSETGIDIHPGAQIGEFFFIDHGTGVVIGETAVIGNNVRLYQAVTLGARHFARDFEGNLLKGLPRHPIVEDDVVIYAGATILGRITIGRGAVIGGNVWLTRDVPPGGRITQAQLFSDWFEQGAGI